MRRILVATGVVAVALFTTASAAWPCGSLVAANGAVSLLRTTTLAAHHDGVEHYVTNFEFAGEQTSFGSIIPLPGEPTEVERAGDWTLQRLGLEIPRPELEFDEAFADSAAPAGEVDVLQEVQIDALDVTILRGGGEEVAAWADDNGFDLAADTPEVLEFYAERSPYFMAARFDAEAAAAEGFEGGDGIPVHLAIPVDDPWVPLRILATGKPAEEIVQADVFLLTDVEPELLTGPGLDVQLSEPASDDLLDDLRSDQNSEWVPEEAWLTYLRLDAPAGELSYDLATDVTGDSPDPVDSGLAAGDLPSGGGDDGWPWQGTVLVLLAGALVVAVGWGLVRTNPSRP